MMMVLRDHFCHYYCDRVRKHIHFIFYKMLLERVFCIASRIGDHVILLDSSCTQIHVLLRIVYKLICKLR